MKTLSVSILVCLAVGSMVGCTKPSQVEPTDLRDQQIGQYVCEVTIQNFTTKAILSAYRDTIEVVKQDQIDLLITGNKQGQLPTLKSLDSRGFSYAGLFTNLSFNQGQLLLTSGPDVMFYEYKGYKLK